MIARLWSACLSAAPLRLWALILAGPPLTGFAGVLVWAAWFGPWGADRQEQQLTILGFALYGCLGIIAVIIVSLASVSVKAQGPGGTSFEVDGDGKDPT